MLKKDVSVRVVVRRLALFFSACCLGSIALSRYAAGLDENQILYLFSISAQVIAAIYGLTLTGFIFLRNELSREEFEDETLVDLFKV
jgi:hypothetical protein